MLRDLRGKKIRGGFILVVVMAALASAGWAQQQDTAKQTEVKAPVSDPAGTATGTAKDVTVKDSANPTLGEVMDTVGHNKIAINVVWTLLAGFLVMFMQAGFALVETGFTRAKNVAHTMSMNFMVYGIGMLGYWICGYALQMGGVGAVASLGGTPGLNHEFAVTLFGKTFGLFGLKGFFLSGDTYDVGIFALFLFQMVFMDTAATIPTGAMAERWKFSSFVIFGFFMSMLVYPIFANWVWGGGWLSQLGANFGLGHGHVDFAGSSVVHMDGKPDPSMLANGMLAGLVAITAPCAFVNSVSAVIIGLIAGVLVVVSVFFIEQRLKIDDPVGAISVHGVNGAWGVLSLGLFADGVYGEGFNGVPGAVRGLFYGDASQFLAEAIGTMTCVAFVFTSFYFFFKLVDVLLGNRVPADVELAGLDLPEMGAPGYPDFVISPGGAEGVAPLMAPVTAAPSPATLHPATVK